MAQCVRAQSTKRIICIGALNQRITLKSRDITEPAQDGVDYGENFAILGSVWARCRTMGKGVVFFDGTNVARRISHEWEIRYRDNVTAETWVEDQAGVNYDILDTENLDQKNEWLILRCAKRGDKALPINQI